MNKETISRSLTYASVGEPISHQLAEKMVKDYNDLHPSEQYCFNVGKNIIHQILAQPGCEGLRIFKAINETGMETIVYAGIDKSGNVIFECSAVNEDGKLGTVEAVIGDKGQGVWNW
jgi:hypothetical protein